MTTAPATPKSPVDALPSGSFSIGIVGVQWSVKSATEVDVTVSVLGVSVDTLDATLSGTDSKIVNSVNVLGLVTGTLGVEAVYGDPTPANNGLWLEGQLTTIGGVKLGPFKYNIIADLANIKPMPAYASDAMGGA